MKYEVPLVASVHVVVEADSPEDAKEAAMCLATFGEFVSDDHWLLRASTQWDDPIAVDNSEQCEVTEVEVVS